jgi:predicted transcriptional regulator
METETKNTTSNKGRGDIFPVPSSENTDQYSEKPEKPQQKKPTQYLGGLVQAGLKPDQAIIYEVLIKNGPLPAGKIHLKTPIKRGLVYKILDELIELGLVFEKKEIGKSAVFEPAHPLKLKELAEKREEEAKQAQLTIENILPPITSEFNLAVGKPGVQFFEGREGVKTVLANSLQTKTEIYSYADIESIVKYINDINDDYVTKRERLKVKKKGIVLDTPFNRNYLGDYHKTVTDVKLIAQPTPPFESIMQIYDDKVSYITLTPNHMLGIIISDQHIYQLHKWLFEWSWSIAK